MDLRRPGFAAALLAAVMGLSACAGGGPTTTNQAGGACPNKGGKLTFARTADVSNWATQANNPTIWAWPLVNLPLVRNNKDASGLDAAAAKSWETSSDYRTFTFHLRDGLKFSNGAPITSADAVDSFQSAMADPGYAGNFPDGTVFSAPDARTFVIKLKDPQPAFVENLLSQVGIYPKGSKFADMYTKPLSSGPFILADWQKGVKAVLKRNPNYWNQPYPCLDEVDLVVVGDSNTQSLQVQAGQVDIAEEIPPSQIASLKSASGVTVPTFPTLAMSLIRLQKTKQPAFQDKNVRLAMNYAIDKEAIIKTVLFGVGAPVNSVLPRTKFWDKSNSPYPYDVAKAKQLMAQSKYPNGFKTTVLTASGDSVENGIATVVKQQLAVIGIDVTIQQVEAGTKFQLRNDKKYEMFMTNTSADQIDPEVFFWFCCAEGYNIGSAWTDYHNQQVDDVFAQIQKEGDPTKRAALFKQEQDLTWADAPDLYINFIDATLAIRSNVKGFILPPTRHHYLEFVYKT